MKLNNITNITIEGIHIDKIPKKIVDVYFALIDKSVKSQHRIKELKSQLTEKDKEIKRLKLKEVDTQIKRIDKIWREG